MYFSIAPHKAEHPHFGVQPYHQASCFPVTHCLRGHLSSGGLAGSPGHQLFLRDTSEDNVSLPRLAPFPWAMLGLRPSLL